MSNKILRELEDLRRELNLLRKSHDALKARCEKPKKKPKAKAPVKAKPNASK